MKSSVLLLTVLAILVSQLPPQPAAVALPEPRTLLGTVLLFIRFIFALAGLVASGLSLWLIIRILRDLLKEGPGPRGWGTGGRPRRLHTSGPRQPQRGRTLRAQRLANAAQAAAGEAPL
jgi:hypothetical protein